MCRWKSRWSRKSLWSPGIMSSLVKSVQSVRAMTCVCVWNGLVLVVAAEAAAPA